MKKYIKIALIVVGAWFLLGTLVPVFFVTCSKTPKEKIAEIKQEYITACEKFDFEKARSIIKKIESQRDETDIFGDKVSDIDVQIDEAMAYINEKEIYYLLSNKSRDNDNRIAYLYDSYPAEQLPDMEDVVEVAITKSNEYLAEKLIRAGVGVNTKIAKAAINANMDQLLDLIISNNPNLLLEQEVSSMYRQNMGEVQYNEYLKKALDSSLQQIYDFDLPSCPAIGTVSDSDDCDRYNDEVIKYNNNCYKLIIRAMDIGYTDFANKVLTLMRPSLEIRRNGSNYNVTESNDQINQARKIIQNGIRK